jgi:hypothetical protein
VGVYNLVHVVVPCRRCSASFERAVQVKYGECYLYDLRPGDSVKWASGSSAMLNRGTRATGRAWVPAYADRPCPACGDEADWADFAVLVRGDVIESAVQAPLGTIFREDQDVVPLLADERPVPMRGG